MGNFAENLNIGKRVLPPCVGLIYSQQMKHESEMLLKLRFFFQFMEWRHSWGSILLSIYRLATQDLGNGNAPVEERC